MSESKAAFVWIWLPQATAPTCAGRLFADKSTYSFEYLGSYLESPGAIALDEVELPLIHGVIRPGRDAEMANALRDAAPDAWGRQVINYAMGHGGAELGLLEYLLLSGSDRPGALDFQASPTHYVPRTSDAVPLPALLDAAAKIERGEELPQPLDAALLHSASVGGARPKALVLDSGRKMIAKFSSSSDDYNVVKGEFVAMTLARRAGLDVAGVGLVQSGGKEVLLVDRFDRNWNGAEWERRGMLSGMTLLRLNNSLLARYASYEDLADLMRHKFSGGNASMEEWFGRMTFNILCGNTDDHARNHAAFWDGHSLSLAPAYDICPQRRSGREASQAMMLCGEQRRSQLRLCLEGASHFLLNESRAIEVMKRQVDVIQSEWADVCDKAEMGAAEQRYFWRRQFLPMLAFKGMGLGKDIPMDPPGLQTQVELGLGDSPSP